MLRDRMLLLMGGWRRGFSFDLVVFIGWVGVCWGCLLLRDERDACEAHDEMYEGCALFRLTRIAQCGPKVASLSGVLQMRFSSASDVQKGLCYVSPYTKRDPAVNDLGRSSTVFQALLYLHSRVS